eukprot:8868101-Pyramimonas_sp.AAC.1
MSRSLHGFPASTGVSWSLYADSMRMVLLVCLTHGATHSPVQPLCAPRGRSRSRPGTWIAPLARG